MKDNTRSNVLKALRYYSIFIGQPELFEQMRRRCLKWDKGMSVDVAIRILSGDAVVQGLEYIRQVKRSSLAPKYKNVIWLAAETGIRANEVFLLGRYWKELKVEDGFFSCFRHAAFLRRSKKPVHSIS